MKSVTYKQFCALMSCIVLFSGFLLFETTRYVSLQTDRLVHLLKIYDAYDQMGPIALSRLGKANDGGYVVPEKALIASDILMGYGIADDPSFEKAYSLRYHKPSFGFDCGVSPVEVKNELFTFVPECIASDQFLYLRQVSSKQVSSYTQQINKLHLKNKKAFIKMDIEGAEYQAFDTILKHASHVTGIVLEIHIQPNSLSQAIQLLSNLRQQFVLLHVHGNNFARLYFYSNYASGAIPHVLELTYINKSLVSSYTFSKNQSHPLPMDMPNNPHQADASFTIDKPHRA